MASSGKGDGEKVRASKMFFDKKTLFNLVGLLKAQIF